MTRNKKLDPCAAERFGSATSFVGSSFKHGLRCKFHEGTREVDHFSGTVTSFAKQKSLNSAYESTWFQALWSGLCIQIPQICKCHSLSKSTSYYCRKCQASMYPLKLWHEVKITTILGQIFLGFIDTWFGCYTVSDTMWHRIFFVAISQLYRC